MVVCPSCAHENRDGAKFCEECAAALFAPTRAVAEERKVVTVLFCDLVGFTSRAEQLDPEDVRKILSPYYTRVRAELERHGGTVEKFIGDAVMALFGAPTAHEDDPERAVRAALAIRDFAVEEERELRIGITTGEALVALGAIASEGEGMASGDVVNTAARLQSAAPVNGILVDETTRRATRHVVDFDEADPVEAKGKAEPLHVWTVVNVRARRGVDIAHERRAELVGREQELSVLRDALARIRTSRTSQLATLVGVPGIGKSRLVHELYRIVEDDPELITWRQGRCLAYGDGVTLWALGEIIKAQAGIHEQDAPGVATEKIRASVEAALESSSDASWVESNVLALVGLAGRSELGGDRRGESFAAWRRYFEAMADERPLVLVFEDLHWADESLLDFIDELVDWVTDVPLLVVGTARPELLERRPGWGGGKLNATTLALRPLTDEQTAFLLTQLLERSVLDAADQLALIERAGGNPLYAEQFADLFLERGATDELPLPETLQGIIAARLDSLPEAEKELLRDAAVVGKVFWVGSLSRDQGTAAATLHALERKGFVRRQRRSSVEGEPELAFAHALVRDVAYGQIARPDRIEKHRLVAAWIESLGRPEDHAEMVAHHWSAALELARASGHDDGELADRTRHALCEAGDRAYALNAFPTSARYYAEALELWPDHDSSSADLAFRRARSLYYAGAEAREGALEEARDALLRAGSRESAGEAESYLAHVFWYRGQRELVDSHLARAEELVASAQPSAAKARVLSFSARIRGLAGEHEEAIRIGREALALAETLSLHELRAQSMGAIAGALFTSGDRDRGGALMHEARAVAQAANSPIAGSILNNLGYQASVRGDLDEARAFFEEAEALALRFGDVVQARFISANLVNTLINRGRWDEAEHRLADLIAAFESSSHYSESLTRTNRAILRLSRGDVDGAIEDTELAVARSRAVQDPQVVMAQVGVATWVYALAGRTEEARRYASETLDYARLAPNWFVGVGAFAAVADRAGVASRLRDVLAAIEESPSKSAASLELDGDHLGAAAIYDRIGERPRAAESRLAAAKGLIEAGRRDEGEAELEKALAFYRSVGATFFIERGEALLAEAKTA